jgi:hypothetical protein
MLILTTYGKAKQVEVIDLLKNESFISQIKILLSIVVIKKDLIILKIV